MFSHLHVILEDDVAECLDGDELLQSLLDATNQLRSDIDEPDLVGPLEREGKVGDWLFDWISVVGEVKVRFQVTHFLQIYHKFHISEALIPINFELN